jgi:hypothetical protein
MAGSLKATAYVDCKGPIFDGTAEETITEMRREITEQGAQWARDELAGYPMDKTGRATGAFARNLKVLERNVGFSVPGPTIRGVTWSPWLQGASRRNRSSRFKGYRLFSRVRQALADGKLQVIANKVSGRYVDRLGGL